MDADRFDCLSRALSARSHRRALLSLLLGGGVALGARGTEAACRLGGANCTRGGQCCSGRCNKTTETCRCTDNTHCPKPADPCKRRRCVNGTCTTVPVKCASCHECKGGACVEKIPALCDPAKCQILVCDIGQNDWVCESECLSGQTCYDVTLSDGTKTGVCKEKCPDSARICRQTDGTPYCCMNEWNCCGGKACLPPDQSCP